MIALVSLKFALTESMTAARSLVLLRAYQLCRVVLHRCLLTIKGGTEIVFTY